MKYIPLQELEKEIADNDYNKGAIAMLEFISNRQGWEETETIYFKEFFK